MDMATGMITDNVLSLPCPCGSGSDLTGCCGAYILGQATAPTSEALMRSRYSAFVLGEAKYLYNTHHPDFRSEDELAQLNATMGQTEWVGLEILHTRQGGPEDSTGEVTFAAHFKEAGQIKQLSETSHFTKQEGRWFYTEGKARIHSTPRHNAKANAPSCKPGRNDPCWCGSGIKMKKCHGNLP